MTDDVGNKLVIGVKRVVDTRLAESDEAAVGSVYVLWAEIAGVMLPDRWQHALISVDYHASGNGLNTATITFGVSDFETVDFREKEKRDEQRGTE